ncbi:hypothetical protein [Streptomyces uncialis]|uniref:hypothetical protein n=1 Tax=Streptomyces uncialis TaxID=1048205 RepID=UPI0033DFC376
MLDEITLVLDLPRLLQWNVVALEDVEFGSGAGVVTGVSDDYCSLGTKSDDKVIKRVPPHERQQCLVKKSKGLLEVSDLHEIVRYLLADGNDRSPSAGEMEELHGVQGGESMVLIEFSLAAHGQRQAVG